MEAHWIATLRQAYGREQVLDVLEGTPLESHARDNQFGMYLVCRAVGSTDLERWERQLICNLYHRLCEQHPAAIRAAPLALAGDR